VSLVGLLLSLVLAAVVAAALWVVYRAPFRALGVLVAGMSVHNFVVMLLLETQAPGVAVRVLQAWKELVLVLLGLLLLQKALAAWEGGLRPRDLRHKLLLGDWLAAAFAAFLFIFVVLPVGSHLTQRVFDFRALILIPLVYLYGRVFLPAPGDLRWSLAMIAGSACLVGAVGLVELWFVPTSAWVSMGANLLSAYDGHVYHGPGGLPENFVQATSAGPFLRRMVSTYVSPLGVAYVGLLVVPVAVSMWAETQADRRWRALAWASVLLVPAAVVFSVTRLAVGLLVPEFAVLAYLLPGRRTLLAVPAVTVAAFFGLFLYVDVGPTIRHDMAPIRQPAGYALLVGGSAAQEPSPRPTAPVAGSQGGATATRPSPRPTPRRPKPTPTPAGTSRIVLFPGDTSLRGHESALQADLDVLIHHPLGQGLGTYAPRFAQVEGVGESAILGIFDEAGILAGLVYLGLYGFVIYAGWRAFRLAKSWEARALPLVALVGGLALVPITFSSDVWTGLVVTFLPWWAAGYCATVAFTAAPFDASPAP
jgi:hypothetical protein